MKRKIFPSILLILINISGFSQKTEISFNEEIDELNRLGQLIISSKDDQEKLKFNNQLKTLLLEVINQKSAFDYNFDALKTMSILKESQLKIYNWVIPKADGSFQYYAYVTLLTDKDNYKVVELIDNSDKIKSPENQTLMPKSWYGALYYKIVHHKKIGNNYYTLLGWDGNNILTNKKIIDVIQIDKYDYLKLGAPIFKMNKKTKKRLLFEYSEDAVMSIKYHPKFEKIVYDFLIPTSSNLKGVYEYYGPALNRFDAIKMENGRWVYEADTKIELDRSVKDHMWTDPKK